MEPMRPVSLCDRVEARGSFVPLDGWGLLHQFDRNLKCCRVLAALCVKFQNSMKSNQTSIPFSQFRTRIKETLLHLEGVSACIDVSAQVLQYQKGTRMSIGEALAVGKVRKEKLKMSVQGQHTLVNSLRKRNYEYVFHVIYTYFSEYLRRILRAMYDHHPMMVAGKAPAKLDFHEIPKFGTFEAISDYIVEQVFRRLEATKSTTQLLERILDHTGTVIPEETLRML